MAADQPEIFLYQSIPLTFMMRPRGATFPTADMKRYAAGAAANECQPIAEAAGRRRNDVTPPAAARYHGDAD